MSPGSRPFEEIAGLMRARDKTSACLEHHLVAVFFRQVSTLNDSSQVQSNNHCSRECLMHSKLHGCSYAPKSINSLQESVVTLRQVLLFLNKDIHVYDRRCRHTSKVVHNKLQAILSGLISCWTAHIPCTCLLYYIMQSLHSDIQLFCKFLRI